MEAFKYGCIVKGANFCARPALAKQLAKYVAVGQNLVIQGERRIGKTSLVQETIDNMRGWKPIPSPETSFARLTSQRPQPSSVR